MVRQYLPEEKLEKQTTKQGEAVSVREKARKTDNEIAGASICHSRYTENRQRNKVRQYLPEEKLEKQTTKQGEAVSVREKARKTDNEIAGASICQRKSLKNRQRNRVRQYLLKQKSRNIIDKPKEQKQVQCLRREMPSTPQCPQRPKSPPRS